jgi:TatD DNase family protein
MLFDSHCHLDFEAFDADRDQVLADAARAGVVGILNPAVDLASSRAIVALAGHYPPVYAAVGVHPNSATSWDERTLDELRQLSQVDKVLAIGEIGLDYYRQRAPKALQLEIFQAQLLLAREAGLPVIIHTRNASKEDHQATKDALALLIEWQLGLSEVGSALAERPGVLHSYSGSLGSAQQAMARGFYIGITGPVTFRNAPELQDLVAALPLDRILVETDAPFLTPHPYRGKRNEPAYVRLVTDKIAGIHDLAPETVAEATAANAARLLNWRVNL